MNKLTIKDYILIALCIAIAFLLIVRPNQGLFTKYLKSQIKQNESKIDSIQVKVDDITLQREPIKNVINISSDKTAKLIEELNTIPPADSSLYNAVIFLKEFSNK